MTLPQPPPYMAVEKPEDQVVQPSLLPPRYDTTTDQTGSAEASSAEVSVGDPGRAVDL